MCILHVEEKSGAHPVPTSLPISAPEARTAFGATPTNCPRNPGAGPQPCKGSASGGGPQDLLVVAVRGAAFDSSAIGGPALAAMPGSCPYGPSGGGAMGPGQALT